MNSNSIFENLSDFSNSYVDKIHRSKEEDDDANIAFLCNTKEAVLHNRRVNIDSLLINSEYNFVTQLNIVNKHLTVEPYTSNVSHRVKGTKRSDKKFGGTDADPSQQRVQPKMASKVLPPLGQPARKKAEQNGRQRDKQKIGQIVRNNSPQTVDRGTRQNTHTRTVRQKSRHGEEPGEMHTNERSQDVSEEKHLISSTTSSDWYDKNMYRNYYLLNKSCAYLKSKCVRDTVLDPYGMQGEERINGNHQVNLRNQNDENDEKDCHACTHSYPYDNAEVDKKRAFHFKIDKEKASDLGTYNGNMSSDILLYSSEYDDGKYPNKIETYDFLKECDYENGTNSVDRTKYDDDGSSLEMLHIPEKEKYTNISNIKNFSVRTHSYRQSGETYAQQKKTSSSNMSQLMKIKFLINKKKNSSNRKNKSFPFSDYKNNNTLVKFLMAEIKIETKLYKLILFLFLLILLSLFKDMSKYIVITRKCYNIYESPIKSIKRILKCVIWALKIGYKFTSPFILYMLSFFGVIIFRIFLLLNIPIFLLLLYCKFFLKNEESLVKLYLLFVVNMYKYIVTHFVHILKNYSNDICFRDFLSVICLSFHFIFVSLYRIVHRIYTHKVR
ncbi:conserved Plasmodium membrane protein, unknown function [Plasmodium knowlesi strain H]|uniref:Uncharacterized protein n=3 Tax=Plasmodium knowlesi TaxID=5850 RepID=A0A5E7X0C7_PLAKH|nr:conserved Plasmodium membrane protein, unknown function [Plasmodium knowlesi strain H]OTN65953.1 Uncharacterized protein PKNOH_S100055800 [Plasmodium knowlesi]CAA9987915.1 conserved Plasmodium membrane protein, unknown function [Plasmodium knowlesi strain H]SBO22240.1 conserved Plasmodium membrane protein, unknown function [Plasmodium knowlesi strain H]SBO28848.1 conserved Plasmodium membrane protein, unknown function [Plasmodium knowlesi strain H]VVS77389.1 conserved Plasmodium membrane pr